MFKSLMCVSGLLLCASIALAGDDASAYRPPAGLPASRQRTARGNSGNPLVRTFGRNAAVVDFGYQTVPFGRAHIQDGSRTAHSLGKTTSSKGSPGF